MILRKFDQLEGKVKAQAILMGLTLSLTALFVFSSAFGNALYQLFHLLAGGVFIGALIEAVVTVKYSLFLFLLSLGLFWMKPLRKNAWCALALSFLFSLNSWTIGDYGVSHYIAHTKRQVEHIRQQTLSKPKVADDPLLGKGLSSRAQGTLQGTADGFDAVFDFNVGVIPTFFKILWQKNQLYPFWLLQFCLFFYSLMLFALLKRSWSFAFRNHGGWKYKEIKDTHGTAQLATKDDLKRLNIPSGIPIGEITEDANGKNPRRYLEKLKINTKPSQILRVNPVHSIIIAPPGAGKGVSYVIPTLLDYEGPLVVVDIKSAENYHVTARYRKSIGRKVYLFDPFGITGEPSDSINVLDFIDTNSLTFMDDTHALVDCLIQAGNSSTGNEQYFTERATSLVRGLILYLLSSPSISKERKNF
jgi:hypothetical protein